MIQAKTIVNQVKCPPKLMLNLNELYGVVFRKIEHFITPDVRTSTTAVNYLFGLFDLVMRLTRNT
jgi:hypothetical protein